MINAMKSAVKPFAVSLALATTLGIASSPAAAAVTHLVDADTGELTGATGLIIGGETYRVDFEDGIANDVFNPGITPLPFTDFQSARNALSSMDAQVFTGAWDTNPELTAGIEYAGGGYFSTPYLFDADKGYYAYWQNERYIEDAAPHGGVWGAPRTKDWSTNATNTWARFTRTSAVAAVPEPSTYAMMAMGLFGIAGLRRRQNKA